MLEISLEGKTRKADLIEMISKWLSTGGAKKVKQ